MGLVGVAVPGRMHVDREVRLLGVAHGGHDVPGGAGQHRDIRPEGVGEVEAPACGLETRIARDQDGPVELCAQVFRIEISGCTHGWFPSGSPPR